MKIVDHNVLYRDHILLIVYSYILVHSIYFKLSDQSEATTERGSGGDVQDR
jgi:hypothetical protein